MTKHSEIAILAAKLIGSTKATPSCHTCLGAGYSWTTIGPYTIPILCQCKNRYKYVTIRDKSAPDLDGSRSSTPVEFTIRLIDVIPEQSKIPSITQNIADTYKYSIARESILGYNIREDNVNEALDIAVDALLDAGFSDEIFGKVKSLLKGQ
jgi:hypothetical protein